MSGQKFQLDYIDVASRIVEFRTKHSEGSLQQVALDFREVNGGWWVIYTAAAYRTPDDPRPGIGTAWEPIPGRTNFTRDSEVQNAETAAWGRAIVAALAADTKRGIASAEEVRNSQDRQPRQQRQPEQPPADPAHAARVVLAALANERGIPLQQVSQDFYETYAVSLADADAGQVKEFTERVRSGEVAA